MPDILKDYFEALERLKRSTPVIVPKGTRITNDSVSLEAGRKKGTIKKSRPIFRELVEAIDAAGVETKPRDEVQGRLKDAKMAAARYRGLWEEALAREVSLIKQLSDERHAWAKERATLTGGKVASIRKT